MHTVPIAVGNDGASDVGAVWIIFMSIRQTPLLADPAANAIRYIISEYHSVHKRLIAFGERAGHRSDRRFRRRTPRAIRKKRCRAQAAMILTGKFRMEKISASIEHAQPHAFAGKPPCVGRVGVDGAEPPIGRELVGLPRSTIGGRARRAGGRPYLQVRIHDCVDHTAA
ncbi:hypothetical protein M2410_000790 [Stenotrophomonas chelatiphaga]|nr:hypothetical protein [Stenotrophomonas chelatiphaga]